MTTFKLSLPARSTAGWQDTKAFLEGRLAELREQNDQPHDEIKTAGIRANIALIKEMLAVDKKAPEYKPMAGHEA